MTLEQMNRFFACTDQIGRPPLRIVMTWSVVVSTSAIVLATVDTVGDGLIAYLRGKSCEQTFIKYRGYFL